MMHDKRKTVVRLTPVERRSGYTVLPTRTRERASEGESAHATLGTRGGASVVSGANFHVEQDTREKFASPIVTSVWGKIASTLLIPMIFIQPLLPLYAYAADDVVALPAEETVLPPLETAPEPTPESAPISSESIPVEVTPPAVEEVVVTEVPAVISGAVPTDTTPPEITLVEETAMAEAALTLENTPIPPLETSPTETATTSDTTITPVLDEPILTTPATTTDEVVPSVATDTTSPTTTTTDEIIGDEVVATTSDEIIIEEVFGTSTDEIIDEEVATDTPAEEQEEVLAVIESTYTGPSPEEIAEAERVRALVARNELKREVADEFLRGCISFEHTGYYCLPDGSRGGGASAGEETIPTVSAAQSESGYKQITVTKNGVATQITHDNWDNAFPTQDITGTHFVWQGMKGGRWQIFYGEMNGTDTPRILQVTDSKESNFNPKVDGTHLVWQGWVDENWEIFLATRRDASSPFASEHLPLGNTLLNIGPEWSVERLTINGAHDMFPSLHGDIVTWQTHEGENWVVYAYSISDQTKTKLSSDGTKSENPRFAITWEERDQAGGVRLMSYDMSTGKKSNLTAEAQNVANNPFRENPPAPVSQPNQAALPIASGTGSSTPVRGDDDAGGNNPPTP